MATSTVMYRLALSKDNFITSLRNILASNTPTQQDSNSFFYSLFDLCRYCADSHQSIADQFNIEEKQELATQFRRGLPIINKALIETHCGLHPSVVHHLKQVRSSVQYLADDFTFLDQYDEEAQAQRISELLKEIVQWDRVEMIDEELPGWEESGGEFYIPPDIIDLTNIPRSHTWWSDDDRSSNEKFVDASEVD